MKLNIANLEYRKMAIQELTKGLEQITELWFMADDKDENLCEEVKRVIEAGLAFLESMDEPKDAEVDSSVSSVHVSGKGEKRSLIEDLNPRDQTKRKQNQKKLITISPFGDGYQWSKYGQKNIHNAVHPRCYYRCTYSECNARKQVQQKSSDYPPEYEVIFTDEHTCSAPKISVTKFWLLSPTREQQMITFEPSETKPTIKDKPLLSPLSTDTCISSVNMQLSHFNHSDSYCEGLDFGSPMSPAGQFYGSDALAYDGREQPFDPFVSYFYL